jgi:hypothetical protein
MANVMLWMKRKGYEDATVRKAESFEMPLQTCVVQSARYFLE